MLVALTIRTIFTLRVILVTAQSIFIIVALMTDNMILLFWNSIFIIINSVQIIIIIIQNKPVSIPEDVQDIYESVFDSLNKREFLYFWQMGSLEIEKKNTQLIKQGDHQQKLLLVIEGEASVKNNHRIVAKLGRGNFVAEMSFLSGNPASADVIAKTELRYVYWDQNNINALKQLNPSLYNKINNTLSLDVVNKLRKTNQNMALITEGAQETQHKT